MPTATLPPRVLELQDVLEKKNAALAGMEAGWKFVDGAIVMSKDANTEYLQAVQQGEEIKGLIDVELRRVGLADYQTQLNAPTDTPVAAGLAAQTASGIVAVKSLADHFVDSKAYQRYLESGVDSDPAMRMTFDGGVAEMKAVAHVYGRKDIFNLSGGSVTHQALGNIQTLGLAEQRKRQTHIRDLFPRARTTSPLLYGIRETGWVNNARVVPQRTAADGGPATGGSTDIWGRKPKSNLILEPVVYPVATIAHTLDAHETILKDEPRLRTFIDQRMTDGVMYAEDYELLFGTPGGEKITGIMNTPGVQTYTGLSTDKYSVQVRRAATRAMLAEYQPTGIVVNPLDWEKLEVEEDGMGGFRVAIAVAVGAETRLWRMDVVATTAMPEGVFLLGAFGLGAIFHDREQVSVVVSTENRDNFETNVVTFRAEERGALEVPRPESFVAGEFTEYVAA